MLTCRSLRGAVVTSGSLLVAAWVVEMLATRGLAPTVTSSYLGFGLLLAAAAVLGVTFLRSLLPKNATRLARCEH
jgi:hypothetical protein